MDSLAIHAARELRRQRDGGDLPNYETTLEGSYLKFLRSGDTVIDVGAHTGRHAAKFTDAVGMWGKVLAFEPNPEKAAILRGQIPRGEVREKALSRAPGKATFTIVQNAPEESGLQKRGLYNVANPEFREITVEVSTIDIEALSLDAVSYIKIDIEGGEIDCLKGGETTIRRYRPIISAEYGVSGYKSYGYEKETLYDLAEAMGYVMADLFGNPILTRDEWMFICDLSYWDYFLVPKERLNDWGAKLRG